MTDIKQATPEEEREFERVEQHNNPIEPNHYTKMAISPLEYIEANNINYTIGNVIKYVSRYENKNGLEDLKKAQWYLSHVIDYLEGK